MTNYKCKTLQINFDINTKYAALKLILCIVLASKEIEVNKFIQLLLCVPGGPPQWGHCGTSESSWIKLFTSIS